MFDPKLKQDDEIDNQTLCDIFKCSPQGGMRKSNTTKTLTIVSNHIKSIYDDRWIDDVFHYTGMGRKGDQSLGSMQNKTLAQSGSNGIGVHLFEVFSDQIYTYIGQVELENNPYKERQPDENENVRDVWMFPLRLLDSGAPIISRQKIEKLSEIKAKKAKRLSSEKLQRMAENSAKVPGRRNTSSTQYERSIWVAEHAKRVADGICQLCKKPAPFRKPAGEPYLETHHIEWLSNGGEDTIENTVALCPNCHRRMHVLNDDSDIMKLKTKI